MCKAKTRIVAKILVCLLCLMALVQSVPAFALEESVDYDLVALANELQESRKGRSSEREQIIILRNDSQIQEVKCIEGDKVDIVTYDWIQDKLYIDGLEISAEIIYPEVEPYVLGQGFDHVYQNIQLRQQIMQFTAEALKLILGYYMPGGIASLMAQEMLSRSIGTSYAYCDACYCISYKRIDSSNLYYLKFWDMYWDESYYDFCASYTQTIYM